MERGSYPTHGLGPITNINRGNQFLTLVSMSIKARGIWEWASGQTGARSPAVACGNTIIQCAHGEMIVLTLDATLPGKLAIVPFEPRVPGFLYKKDRFEEQGIPYPALGWT
ncbi:hypothetical protein [Paenibacillus ginsengarvi]|uniref:hypothetical protein n=1 Tax=Paenibacillus ginsengarvi TaxID=400777 RepID=UPI003084136A